MYVLQERKMNSLSFQCGKLTVSFCCFFFVLFLDNNAKVQSQSEDTIGQQFLKSGVFCPPDILSCSSQIYSVVHLINKYINRDTVFYTSVSQDY